MTVLRESRPASISLYCCGNSTIHANIEDAFKAAEHGLGEGDFVVEGKISVAGGDRVGEITIKKSFLTKMKSAAETSPVKKEWSELCEVVTKRIARWYKGK